MRNLRAWLHEAVLLALVRMRPARFPFAGHSSRILCLAGDGLTEILCALPLLHALRRHFPHAHLAVACDEAGAPIAEACEGINEIIMLEPGQHPGRAALRNHLQLRDYHWAIAVKGDFDRHLAVMTRLTHAPIRIGFGRRGRHSSDYFTDTLDVPKQNPPEHEMDTLLRLGRPLGMLNPLEFTLDCSIRLPDSAREFSARILANPPFDRARPFCLINISHAGPVTFREEDLIALVSRLLGSTEFVVGLVAGPDEQNQAEEIAICMHSNHLTFVSTAGPLELAALLDEAHFLLTPTGPAAHLAGAVGTPALVLWSGADFEKWRSRGPGHAFVHLLPGENIFPVERVWQALQPFLAPKR